MLAQRVITAVVLLALLVPALLADARWPFNLLTLVFMAAAGWEWARLSQLPQPAALAAGALVALACVGAKAIGWADAAPSPAWWFAVALWLPAGTLTLRAGPGRWLELPRAARFALGLAALWAAWLAVNQARALGLGFILSVFCLVWAADIAAYFGGRRFGRRKLAPTISPGKSWEGVYSGMAGVLLLGLAWSAADARWPALGLSLYSRLFAGLGVAGGLLALLALAGLSVVGDLSKSVAKRAVGVKDSSKLLPGHGGVLDRIDALLPVFPAALALASL
ncbi:MAG: phosphatidate cytidylyltransferase [Proteobacteria bacterium]|nr:phosphatidate cytidylyltransferase [Pseudomonadota bacterium]